ncbi:hypothetical protein [Halovivax sp.]|nr:hypothetical protein [Halovivax sp.]
MRDDGDFQHYAASEATQQEVEEAVEALEERESDSEEFIVVE